MRIDPSAIRASDRRHHKTRIVCRVCRTLSTVATRKHVQARHWRSAFGTATSAIFLSPPRISEQRAAPSNSSEHSACAMPAPLFKRFAPPTPATTTETSLPAVTQNNEKKSKKTADVGAAPVEDAQQDVVMEDMPTPKPVKKSKKRKSEAVQEEDEQNKEVSKKHRAVFSKFEKASKLAEARKDETSETIEEPEEDLHGTQ